MCENCKRSMGERCPMCNGEMEMVAQGTRLFCQDCGYVRRINRIEDWTEVRKVGE